MSRTLYDVIRGYLSNKAQNNEEKYISELMGNMQKEITSYTIEEKSDIIQQLVFINLVGYDVSWADFTVLEVMSSDTFSCKKIAYTAATQMWNTQSDVVLMSTNRIQRDLTSIMPLVAGTVLTSLAPFLSLPLAQYISHDVIALMSGARPQLRQKAIMTFYHICLKYPDALRPGFTALKNRLDDPDNSVMFSALTVMSELCAHNPQNFIGMIPKFHKMLETSPSNWISVRLINIMRMLSAVEPRLPKKLVGPFTTILETTSSITVLFECVRTIIEIPITNPILLTYATQRMQAFLEHKDPNLRFLCLSLFIKLIEIQPKLVAEHKELITQCLDSSDESTRLLALDLLAALANNKTVDGIVAKMFDHFRESKSIQFKDQILRRVIEICSKNDYELITDFEWYITILVDFLEEGGFTAYDSIAEQMLDLSNRVPATRPTLIDIMGALFENYDYKDKTKLLLAASYIIGEFSDDIGSINELLNEFVLQTDERVQCSCVSSALKLFIKHIDSEQAEFSNTFIELLSQFVQSTYAEVQDRAQSALTLLSIIQASFESSTFSSIQSGFIVTESDEFQPIERPNGLDDPILLFKEEEVAVEKVGQDDPLGDKPKAKVETNENSKIRRPRRKQAQVAEKPIVLKANEKPIVIAPKPKAKASAISEALANVDLTAEIADSEVRELPRPMPYNQDLLLKQQQERSKSHKKHKHHHKEETPVVPVAKPPQSAPAQVTGPKPRSRIQTIGENSSLIVNAVEFNCSLEKPGYLEVELQIHNQTENIISSIDLSAPSPGNSIKVIEIPSITAPIQPVTSVTHKIVIELSNIITPQKFKLLFIPVDGGVETLESCLRIFPSYFLMSAPQDEIEAAAEKCTFVEKLKPTTSASPRDVLQCCVNVLRGNLAKASDASTRVIYSKTSQKHEVITTIQASLGSVYIELKASEALLAKSLIKELEMKIRALDQ